MSGIGKGTATASISKILKSKGFSVSAVKIDPYLNIDAGTMNPIEHGEVFVTKDGIEADQDMGNYERFLDEEMTTDNYITSGRIYQTVLKRERSLGYKGRCVEAVPDIPNEIISRLKRVAKKTKADFVLVEIGGTIGEYQNFLFFEAARMMKLQSPQKILFILVSYLPIPENIGEMKTKPTQTATKALNSAGIQPDFILGRAKVPLDEPRKRKISIFCNVLPENVISAPDVKTVYEIPLNFEKEGLGKKILKKFDLREKKKDLKEWRKLVKIIKTVKNPVRIGIVGKYFKTGSFTLMDSYISVIEAIKHACWYFKRKPEIKWLSAQLYEKDQKALKELKAQDGIIIPGGFGKRGIEGKIKAIGFCRENKIPFLGLCLGMQLATIEFARNVAGFKKANSTEFNEKTPYPVISTLAEQKIFLKEKKYGGTMRLGEYSCEIKPKTLSWLAYSKTEKVLKGSKKILVFERHRHRYEFNNQFREKLEEKGLKIAGLNPKRDLVEIIELKGHPFFVGCQFHPEFKSRPLKPHPLFREFIAKAITLKH
jgi:CTP synthase